jgi:hypothetical protein
MTKQSKQSLLEQLREWSKPHPSDESRTYFRPLSPEGDVSKVRIFIVGHNPRTPLTMADNGLETVEKYTETLCDPLKLERTLKHKSGHLSTTRTNMKLFLNQFPDWARPLVAEANQSCFPTRNKKALEVLAKNSPRIFERGERVSNEVLIAFRPLLILCHGEGSLDIFHRVSKDGLLTRELPQNLPSKVHALQRIRPLGTIRFRENGQTATVFFRQHFNNRDQRNDNPRLRSEVERAVIQWINDHRDELLDDGK